MPKPIEKRVTRRREAMCKAGSRPIQIWALDTRPEGFAAECRRQSELVAEADRSDLDLSEFLDAAFLEMFESTGSR